MWTLEYYDVYATIIATLAVFLASYVLTGRTRDVKNRKIKEIRLFDIPLIPTLFAITTFHFLGLLSEGTFSIIAGVCVLVSTILLTWYISLIYFSKRLTKQENEDSKTINN